jgi:hypothetical protein
MVLTLEREPQLRRRWGRIVARAWDDDDFRCRLLAEPEAVLREEGFDIPEGAEIRVEDGDDASDGDCLRLPPTPAREELIDEDLVVTPVARSTCGCSTNCGPYICGCKCGR